MQWLESLVEGLMNSLFGTPTPRPDRPPNSQPQWVWVPGHWRGRTYVKGYWRRIY